MKKALAALVGAVAVSILAGANPAAAQHVRDFNYAVKFVCGTEIPQPSFTVPQEPLVKPGNYATLINIEYLSTGTATDTMDWFVVVDAPYLFSRASQTGLDQLVPFQPTEFDCESIANLTGDTNAHPPFISGYLNIFLDRPAVITAVYSSQGCTSFGVPSTVTGSTVPSGRPNCVGPVTVQVVPQSPVQVDRPTVTGGQ
jgi:hypothetical protein